MTNGPNYSIKVARAVFENDEVVKNITDCCLSALPHILKWGVDFEELKSISIKGTNSIDLPIYNQLTEEEIKSYLEK